MILKINYNKSTGEITISNDEFTRELKEAVLRHKSGEILIALSKSGVHLFCIREVGMGSALVAEIKVGHEGWKNLKGSDRRARFDPATKYLRKKYIEIEKVFKAFSLLKVKEEVEKDILLLRLKLELEKSRKEIKVIYNTEFN